MTPLEPCPTCKTRKIAFDGIHWTCAGCGNAVPSPLEAEKERIKTLIARYVSMEAAEEMVKEQNDTE